MKKCPYCAEEIQDEAIKCKHCGEFLTGAARASSAEKKLAWYFRIPTIVIAVCCVGPLALPMIWWRPRTGMAWKIIWTILILVLTWVMYEVSVKTIASLQETLKQLRTLQ